MEQASQLGYRVEPWVRYEAFDLQSGVPSGAVADPSKDVQSITAGLHFMPHPQVVIKGEWEHLTTAADDDEAVDEVRVGAGFVF